MMQVGQLAFAAPWLLLALAALPVLWWLLRLTPPAPRRVRFPPLRLLLGLDPREETPHRTPPWLIALRLLLASLIILGLAHPLLNAGAEAPGTGPFLLVIDNGWAAAPHWAARERALTDFIDRAEREHRSVILLATAPGPTGEPVAATGLLSAGDARTQAQALRPQPWETDRAAALRAIEALRVTEPTDAIWLSDGVATREDDPSAELAERLQRLGSLTVLRESADQLPLLQQPPAYAQKDLTLRLQRATAEGARSVRVRATGEDGRLVSVEEVGFAAGERSAEHVLDLPLELRNRIASLSIDGEDSAGAVVLLDERWRQRPVGVVSGGEEGAAQPLLSDVYYIERALAPSTEIRRGDILDLLKRELAVLVLADVGALSGPEATALESWVEEGGVLLRFAGARLAQNADTVLPVRLRGDRTLGGAMSWQQPARLAPFPANSPFAGLAVPPDVFVQRQVLAEPEVDLGDKTWARLEDGTPLVTAAKRGEGWIVLVHTTANTDWSNLSLSGMFVDMLERIVGLSEGVVGELPDAPLPPFQTLDGYGRLATPPPGATAASPEVLDKGRVGPEHPPGYYGSETSRRALNLATGIATLRPIGTMPAGVRDGPYAEAREFDLKPWLLAAALGLLLVDMLIALALRGLLRLPRRTAAATAVLVGVLAALGGSGAAQEDVADDPLAIEATAQTRLAYVRTNDPGVDATSNAGLQGLTLVLSQRTAVDAGTPMGVDPETDELAFFPLLYWPIAVQAPLSDQALMRVNHYLKNGGTILFDTRDANSGASFGAIGQGTERLRALVRGLDIPPLTPIPPDHVLTKSFYLMQEFPGRWAGGTLWVEQSDDRVNDGVSSVIIGGNDWASAWAMDQSMQPMYPVVPGGERQREMAFRFGVNLVMYALTGNYKSDQVHVPAILERLGQ